MNIFCSLLVFSMAVLQNRDIFAKVRLLCLGLVTTWPYIWPTSDCQIAKCKPGTKIDWRIIESNLTIWHWEVQLHGGHQLSTNQCGPGGKPPIVISANLFTRCSLLLALVLVRLQNTCKKSWTEKRSNNPTYAIFLKSWGFKDVKYDIPMCQSHSTRPHPIQLVPTMQKSSLRQHFRQNSWKFGSQKLLAQALKVMCQ